MKKTTKITRNPQANKAQQEAPVSLFTRQLVDIGISSLTEMFEEQVRCLVGERYQHNKARKYNRWGSAKTVVIANGQKVRLKRPRGLVGN